MAYLFRIASALTVASFGTFVQPAAAAPVDVTTVTCQEVLQTAGSNAEAERTRIGVMLWWVLGYAATDENGTVMDFGNLNTAFSEIEGFCNKNPQFGLVTAAEKFAGKDAPEPTKQAIDVSTVQCEKIMADTDGNADIWAAIPWLAGYYASDDEDTTFDMDYIGSLAGEVGAFCAQNPKSGLMTAVKSALTTASADTDAADPAAEVDPAADSQSDEGSTDEGTSG